jgi:FeS assembly SUF system protein
MKSLSVVNEKPRIEPPKPKFGDDPRPYVQGPTSTEAGRVEAAVLEKLKTVYDPEIPVNIFELGLIYAIDVDDDMVVHVRMTLTAPNCPVAQSMPEQVRQKAAEAEGATGATIEVVWSPPWNPEMMSEAARLETNLF